MRRVTLFCWFAGVAVSALPVYADNTDKSKELAQIRTQISSVTDDIVRIEQEQNALQAQLAGIEKHYGKTAAALNALRGQITLTQDKLQRLRRESEQLQKAIKAEHKSLASLVKAAHAMGRNDKLKLMLNQQDPVLSSRMMVYYDYLNHDRLAKIIHIGQGLARIDELEQERQQEAGELQQEQVLLQKEQAALADSRTQRQVLLARLSEEQASNKLRLARLQAGERRLQELIKTLQQGQSDEAFTPPDSGKPFAHSRGQLPWPVKGLLARKFGSPRLESRWDGVLIDAGEGAEIRAIAKGTVVFADWFRGYGLLAIIDHGQGFMTLYAFNQSLYASVGNTVAPGDVIATVGKSGGRSRAGLYFGIRRNGKPVDPVKWCRKIDRDRVG
ncbi:MAG: peptidase M23 [Gammaproteobacteria bacterium HGW-Gammaproteobacteria-3]|nr:MAG: peptidase M23 [Gammaproteobacteria bacterium HGW-Gammaproteobacteria-3]